MKLSKISLGSRINILRFSNSDKRCTVWPTYHLLKHVVTWNLSLGIFLCAPSVRMSASSTL